MSTLVNVCRYHLVQRLNYMALPWAVLGFAFAVDVAILALTPAGHSSHRYVGGLAAIFVLLFVLGLQSVARSVPFGLALGLSRRSYYLGTVGLALTLAAVYGLALTVLQVVERATGGWGMKMGFFRVPYILQGPWYLTWLTSFVALALLFVYGMWFGLVYRRWPWSAWWASSLARSPCSLPGRSSLPGPTPGMTSAISSRPSAQWA